MCCQSKCNILCSQQESANIQEQNGTVTKNYVHIVGCDYFIKKNKKIVLEVCFFFFTSTWIVVANKLNLWYMYQQILLQDHMANQSKCYPSAHQCTSISVQSDVIYQNSLIEDVNTWLMRCIPA